jgi:hypothetical protein
MVMNLANLRLLQQVNNEMWRLLFSQSRGVIRRAGVVVCLEENSELRAEYRCVLEMARAAGSNDVLEIGLDDH